MPDEDNNFNGSLGLDLRKCWCHVQPKNCCWKVFFSCFFSTASMVGTVVGVLIGIGVLLAIIVFVIYLVKRKNRRAVAARALSSTTTTTTITTNQPLPAGYTQPIPQQYPSLAGPPPRPPPGTQPGPPPLGPHHPYPQGGPYNSAPILVTEHIRMRNHQVQWPRRRRPLPTTKRKEWKAVLPMWNCSLLLREVIDLFWNDFQAIFVWDMSV